jgi:hypothetical protein
MGPHPETSAPADHPPAGAEPAHPCCEHCAHANGYTHNEDCPACNDDVERTPDGEPS